MNTRKQNLVILSVIAGSLLFFCCVVPPLIRPLFNPPRRSPESIKASLLKETPIGTSREQVRELVKERRWPNVRLSDEPDDAIGAEIGQYRDLLTLTFVEVYWIFDKKDQLVEIHVRKPEMGPF